jgi:predicted DNA-binding transcriptional regulator AlpA
MEVSTKPAAPAAQVALAKKAATAKAKAQAARPPRAPPQTPAKEKAEAQKARVEAAKARLADRLLTKPEVCAIANVTYPTLWAWMLAGKFPRSRIVAGRSMWISTEVEEWTAALPVRPLKGDADRAAASGTQQVTV